MSNVFDSSWEPKLSFTVFLIQSSVKCLCWYLGHAGQLLFSYLCSEVTVYRWKWQCFFLNTSYHSTSNTDCVNYRACSQLKNLPNHIFNEMITESECSPEKIWKTYVKRWIKTLEEEWQNKKKWKSKSMRVWEHEIGPHIVILTNIQIILSLGM